MLQQKELKKLRKAFCEHFVRTGEIERGLRARLAAFVKAALPPVQDRRCRNFGSCAVTECGEDSTVGGYCRKHYMRLYHQRKKEELDARTG
jgi:hypothetical protein